MNKKTSFLAKTVVAVLLGILLLISTTNAFAKDNEFPPEIDFLMMLRDYIKDNHVRDIDDMDLLRGAISGMMESLNDPYSTYFSPGEFQEFNDATSGNFGGIGVVITIKEKHITVVSVLPGTPADRAGLRSNDRIVEVDGKDVREAPIAEVQKLLKGEPDTQVDIGILRDKGAPVLKLKLVRDTIKINPIEAKVLGKGIGYIKINEFNENTVDNLELVLNFFESSGVAGIVLDLRNNPGGYLDQAIDVASYFVPEGPVVNLVERDGATQTFSCESTPHTFKIVVVVNGGSASASEILAGAIKDRGSGIILGEQTFGKATVQRTLNLGSLGAIKLTVARYTTPDGTDINEVGITPDIVVESDIVDQIKLLAPLTGDRTLKYGHVGLDVLGIQERLSLLGFFKTSPDGVYGPHTQKAVKDFQKKRSLSQTGIADDVFYNDLEDALVEHLADIEDIQLRRAIDLLLDQLNPKPKAS